jgi:hypothetical protein
MDLIGLSSEEYFRRSLYDQGIGKLIFELSAKADKLKGKFVSYGAESEDILKEELEIHKE